MRKSLPPNINLIGYDESKILIRFSYAFDDEIFNFLKLWIPYATIQSPKELQEKFNKKLVDYVRDSSGDVNEVSGESSESSGDSGESKDSSESNKNFNKNFDSKSKCDKC